MAFSFEKSMCLFVNGKQTHAVFGSLIDESQSISILTWENISCVSKTVACSDWNDPGG